MSRCNYNSDFTETLEESNNSVNVGGGGGGGGEIHRSSYIWQHVNLCFSFQTTFMHFIWIVIC